jgi:hypothetical protein
MMHMPFNSRGPIGALVLLFAITVSPSALAQINTARPFVGGTFFGDSGFHRESWSVGGGVAAGWALSDEWGAQVELELPTRGTTVETYGTPCSDPTRCWSYYSRSERSTREVTVSVLFGRHLPQVGRFRATLLLGPSARIELVNQTLEYQPPYYYGVPSPGPLEHEEDQYSRLYPAFVAGFDGEIGVGKNLSIVPQLRFYLTPKGDWEGPASIVRPGVSVRWRF